MNIDLWLSFRNSAITTSFGRKRGKQRFLLFAFFSISVPLVVTTVAVVTDYKIQTGLRYISANFIKLFYQKRWSKQYDIYFLFYSPNVELSTEIGVSSCALNIQNWMVQLYYFYGVVGVLLIINLMFFFCTVICLRERQKETKFAHRQCTATDSADLLRFKLFTRLFFIMGILWIFELISWLTVSLQLSAMIQLIFVVTDCLNALQGIALFFLFVWKPQTWRQLRKKWKNIFLFESQASLTGAPNTIKSSVKSSTKSSGSSCKASSPTEWTN